MCGFIVVFNKHLEQGFTKDKVVVAGQLLSHRGMDDNGYYGDQFIQMYFSRLAIIDIKLAHQPMLSSDKRYILVFNGEIYNYLELKQKLIDNYQDEFITSSDTEVVLKMFQRYGSDCVKQFRGMFAIVIWDKQNKKLFITRDRLGIKPLYYVNDDNSIILASEIKAITSLRPKLKLENKKVVFKYLARGWADDNNETFYQGIKSFPVAHWLNESFQDQPIFHKYWHLTDSFDNKKFDKYDLQTLFVDNIDRHLQADVDISATLSGGIDTNSIVNIAHSVTDKKLKSFTISPPQTDDENYWVNKTVDYLGIEHELVSVELNLTNKHIIQDILYYHDEPFLSSSCIYQFMLRKKISEAGYKVLLVGEGGDEVFGGYKRMLLYYMNELLEKKHKQEFIQVLISGAKLFNQSIDQILIMLNRFIIDYDNQSSAQENLYPYEVLSQSFINEYQNIAQQPAYPFHKEDQFKHLLDMHLSIRDLPYVLRIEDRNSMAFGIESRVPLLDHVLIEKVFSYSFIEFMKNATNKKMLREIITDYVHPDILKRQDKSPRPGNDAYIVYELLKDEVLEALRSQLLETYLNKMAVFRFKADAKNKNNDRAIVWLRIYLLYLWKKLLLNNNEK